MKYSFISIDYQNDFCLPGGIFYKDRPCQVFINSEFIPYIKKNNIKIAEIISDYRLPRPSEEKSYCIPGKWGYNSAIDETVRVGEVWIKSMNSPEWIRENGGDPTKEPGKPYPNPEAFDQWLKSTIGTPDESGEVVLIGLTLDCCVLCVAQQLYFRGYKVRILKEGTDIYSIESLSELLAPYVDYKDILFNSTHGMWSKLIDWNELRSELEKNSNLQKASSKSRNQKDSKEARPSESYQEKVMVC